MQFSVTGISMGYIRTFLNFIRVEKRTAASNLISKSFCGQQYGVTSGD